MIHLEPNGRDDSDALEAAMYALPRNGGTIQLGTGVFRVSRPIRIGSGSAIQESYQHGVTIRGEGSGRGGRIGAATTIKWIGPPAPWMIEYQGPVSGGGLEALNLEGDANLGGFLHLNHLAGALFRDVTAHGYATLGMKLTTVKGNHDYGCSDHVFEKFNITGPLNSKASAAWFTGGPNGLDSCSIAVTGGNWIYGGHKESFGLMLEGADNLAFQRTNFLCYEANQFKPEDLGPSVLIRAFASNPAFPLENTFYACSMTTYPRWEGEGPSANLFLPLCEGDAFAKGALPPIAGGIMSTSGIFGSLMPRSGGAPTDAQFSVTSTNGGHNGAGCIAFKRQGWTKERGVFDELVGSTRMEYFDGFIVQHRGEDMWKFAKDGVYLMVNGAWVRKVG